ncbi:FHA domain-containing protein [Comamonas sp. JUb58]|uniref:FHA domain-containing protein n=1 Tax=Comamonas sp. JUb58 TaxID=2485114 RepID=UPI00105EE9AF|nr:FHA domain-containing protein [Comamonas sp. JUb58]TDS68882.1 FHA domain-containing protein [Comamonas sp. JUb58]
MLPEIVVTHKASAEPRSITLQEGFTTFGRFRESVICLNDPGVSRDHGAFSLRFGVLVIEDHHSLNGVVMDGIKVKRKVLHSGDRLNVGPFEIYVKSGSVDPLAIAGNEGQAA